MILSDMKPVEHLRQAPVDRPEKWNKGLIDVNHQWRRQRYSVMSEKGH